MRSIPIFVAMIAMTACESGAPQIPWVHGMRDVVASTGVGEPTAPFDEEIAPNCGVGASRPIELVADIAPAAGRETIVASYSAGVAVFDREDRLVMQASGYPCDGSSDELEALAVGSIYGSPTLALVATSGGRRETSTWVGLYRIDRTLEAIFAGVVETRRDDIVERGAIYVLPGALVHRHPDGRITLWRLDAASKIYVPILPDTPHDEPPIVSLR